ncbi:MAG: hypothetical protein AAB614_00115 [Patescibacteria group bacterium]
MKKIFKKNENGIAIYLSILILASVVSVALSVSSLLIGEFKISGDLQESSASIYVADSGLEAALYSVRLETLLAGIYPCSDPQLLGAATTMNCSVTVDTAYIDINNSLCNNVPYDCTSIVSTGQNNDGTYFRKLQAIYQNR